MLSLHATKAALVAGVAFALSAAALPYAARDAPSNGGCPSLGIGSLGYNASGIPIYSPQPPQTRIEVNTYSTNSQQLVATGSSANAQAGPQQQFVFNNCSYTPAAFPGKGSIDSWQGYIQALNRQGAFQCVTVDRLETKDAQLSLKDCVLDASKPGGVDASQHFQFKRDSFFDYYNVIFLGAGDGNQQGEQWSQGIDYHFNISSSYSAGPHRPLNVSYAPTSVDQKQNFSEFLVAQIAYIR